jgi:hypothetical protein
MRKVNAALMAAGLAAAGLTLTTPGTAQAAACTARIYNDVEWHSGDGGRASVVATCERTVVRVKIDVAGGPDTGCKNVSETATFSYHGYHPAGHARARGVKNC